MRGPRFPDSGANPRQRRDDQVYDSAKHENLEGAVPFAQSDEKQAQSPVGEAENAPGNQTGDQQVRGFAKVAQHGNKRQSADERSRGEVPLHRDAVENRHAIGKVNPATQDDR